MKIPPPPKKKKKKQKVTAEVRLRLPAPLRGHRQRGAAAVSGPRRLGAGGGALSAPGAAERRLGAAGEPEPQAAS